VRQGTGGWQPYIYREPMAGIYPPTSARRPSEWEVQTHNRYHTEKGGHLELGQPLVGVGGLEQLPLHLIHPCAQIFYSHLELVVMQSRAGTVLTPTLRVYPIQPFACVGETLRSDREDCIRNGAMAQETHRARTHASWRKPNKAQVTPEALKLSRTDEHTSSTGNHEWLP